MKIRNPIIVGLGIRIALLMLRALYLTCRVRVRTAELEVAPYSKKREGGYIFAFWHDQVIHAVFAKRTRNMAGLVSGHRDGGYLAKAMELLGVKAVRGSSTRGGANAVREILTALEGRGLAITPDGPQGPEHKLKPGAVFLASHLGYRICPMTVKCTRYWTIKAGWGHIFLPKPFSTVVLISGESMEIPEELSSREMVQQCRRVEAAINELRARVESRSVSELLEAETLLPADEVENVSVDRSRSAA